MKRKNPLLGHSDGSASVAPANVTNSYAQSHTERTIATQTATLTPLNSSYTATAGSSHTVNLSVSQGWTSIYTGI